MIPTDGDLDVIRQRAANLLVVEEGAHDELTDILADMDFIIAAVRELQALSGAKDTLINQHADTIDRLRALLNAPDTGVGAMAREGLK